MPKSTAAAKPSEKAPEKKLVIAPPSGKERETAFPKGCLVRYTGERTQFAGQTGTVTGYRGPTTGLWVKFGTGLGSISTRGAQVLAKAPKAKPAGKSASRVKKVVASSEPSTASEPSQEAEAQSA